MSVYSESCLRMEPKCPLPSWKLAPEQVPSFFLLFITDTRVCYWHFYRHFTFPKWNFPLLHKLQSLRFAINIYEDRGHDSSCTVCGVGKCSLNTHWANTLIRQEWCLPPCSPSSSEKNPESAQAIAAYISCSIICCHFIMAPQTLPFFKAKLKTFPFSRNLFMF